MSELSKIEQLLNRASVKFALMNYDNFIADNRVAEITSSSIFEANSKMFHPDGLFSEAIFGPITELKRFTTFGHLNLNTNVIHPIIFNELIVGRKLYTGILSGNKVAKFSKETNDFELADEDDSTAGTGYSFFISHLSKLYKKTSGSMRTSNKLVMLKKYAGNLTTNKYLVLPAGLRDIKLTSARLSKDDINKIYLQLINLTTSLSEYSLSDDKIFDDIRYKIQSRIHDVHKHILELTKGKQGFFQEHYSKRKVTYSTRNVASVNVQRSVAPNDPLFIDTNSVAVPLLNVIKAFQPMFVKYIKRDLFGEVITDTGMENIKLTDMNTFESKYVEVKPAEIRKYSDAKEIGRLINHFKHTGFRKSPVAMIGADGKTYCLLLKYIEGTDIFLGKNKEELKLIVEGAGKEFSLDRVEPVSWSEAMYIASIQITHDRHVLITRYPVLEEGSLFPAKCIVVTTDKTIHGKLHFNQEAKLDVLRFPIVDEIYTESVTLQETRLAGLNADFDGDMVNVIGVWLDDANQEIKDHLRSIKNLVSSDFSLNFDTSSDIIKLVMHNLSK